MVPDLKQLLNRLTVIVLLLASVYVILLLPGTRSQPGFNAAIDGWLNGAVDLGVVAVLLVRSQIDRRQRAAWLFLSGGLIVTLAGSITYYAHYQFVEQPPTLSWADVGWLAFYPLLYVGMVLLLRTRVPRVLRSIWLDGVVAGLTAAAPAAALLGGKSGPFEGLSTVGLLAFYPIADLILLALSVGAVVILGKATGLVWWLLCGAFMIFAVTDVVYAATVARGAYVSGGPLDLGWVLARLGLLAAAWASVRVGARSRPVPLLGANVLTVPGVCLVVVIGLLFYGTRMEISLFAAGLGLAAGALIVGRTLLTFREVRDLAEARRQARTDELTGLANRRHFYDVLNRACAALDRRSCAVILVDLDRFKEINDGFGHQVGDRLLRMVGQRLMGFLRADDVVARLGGDEYALVLHGTSEEEALGTAKRVRAALRAPFTLDAATVAVDASVGVACGPLHGRTADELVAMADLAMYAAKDQRLGVLIYDDSRDATNLHRLERVATLREGISKGQMELHYQPQVELISGSVVGVEALVRWRHPAEGLVPPMEFIPLAESSGLMVELTAAVLDTALSQCRRLRAGGIPLRVAVNVSPSALVDSGFTTMVRRLLVTHDVAPPELVLELTEELLMDNRQRGVQALFQLREAGVRVAIDDYGTGYSSLAYLKDLPVNELKLDRTFVADLTSSTHSAAIVSSTIDLAHALGLEIVAEGVEDPGTLQALRDAGCDLAQGYLLSRPVPAEGVPGAVTHAAAQAERLPREGRSVALPP